MSKFKEFDDIVKDILKNKEFCELDNEYHHGITRYGHSMRVAKLSYNIARYFNLKNYEEMTRAALLHDFFKREEIKSEWLKVAFDHPMKAYENASKYYELNEMQKNIIQSHMFPLSYVLPRYKESWIVSLVDKTVATYEYTRYKATITTTIYIMFIFNMLTK